MYCLLPCVGSLMSGQGNRPCKTLVTLVTFKRILSCMGSLMLCQVSRICECLITLVTLKDFSPVWVLLCYVRLPDSVKASSHWSHFLHPYWFPYWSSQIIHPVRRFKTKKSNLYSNIHIPHEVSLSAIDIP